MYLTNENLTFVKKNESLFVSMKYLDSEGRLNQIDSVVKNILADSNNHGFEINKHTCLLPITSKGFRDPFRAHPTTSFLCVNIADQVDFRQCAGALVYNFPANMVVNFEVEITFWIEVDDVQNKWQCDPYDTYSNLRSDILYTLEEMNIKTTIHRPGGMHGECIISFKAQDIIDLADNFILAKFVISNIAANYGQKVTFAKNNISNLKIIFGCNNNDAKSFLVNSSANADIIKNYNDFLQIDNINSKTILKRKLFNNDCKLEVQLTTSYNFNPYINFAFIVLFFSDKNDIIQRLDENNFDEFIKKYKFQKKQPPMDQ